MKTTINKLASTNKNELTSLVLRSVFAAVMFAHGAQLFLGWFGGYGVTASAEYFISTGLSAPIAYLIILLEFFGSVFLFLGLCTRLVAAAFIILVIGMIVKVHYAAGFFMNWYGTAKGEGYEYHLLMLSVLAALLVNGGGLASIDAMIYHKTKTK